jgi:3-isopropylmalate/(R)-2-methylmalate dehydratase small subunit
MPAGAREALVSGQWDFLGQLLDNTSGIRERAAQLPYMAGYAK